MTETIISSLLSLVGTLAGTFGGILVASKLTVYRIEQLEKQVDKHNKVVERTFKLEGDVKELQHEVSDLKKYHKP
jgi:hypothetical protein